MERNLSTEINNRTLVASVTNLAFASYDRVLFKDLDLNIKMGEVTAITGKSGSGKTVFLKILNDLEKPHEGKVFVNPKAKIIFVPQELEDADFDKDLSIRTVLKKARGLEDLEKTMLHYETVLSSGKYEERDMNEYGEVMEAYQELGGYNSDADMHKILSGLGLGGAHFDNITLDTKLGEVSSGQLKKIMLATALYSNASLILLDEPSSHLDIKSVDWLSDYLRHTNSAVVLTSNNSSFIDGCASQTVGFTDSSRTFVFDGGYTDFKRKRDAIIEAEKLEAAQVANKFDQLKETDNMFKSKGAYKRSKDMAQVGRQLHTRMERLNKEYENMPGSTKVYNDENVKDLSFIERQRSGTDVVSLVQVTKNYNDFEAVDLSKSSTISIRRGEKWLFWGPNGSGKSTLVKMIVDSVKGEGFLPDSGTIGIGTGVDIGYYSPEIPSNTGDGPLIDEVTKRIGSNDLGKASSVLRFFGFSNSAIFSQDIRTLSFGEKKRLILAKIMLKQPNLLILDEPTGDYMPEEIKERLAKAISSYSGTLILVSHDEEFINKTGVDHRLEMFEGKAVVKN